MSNSVARVLDATKPQYRENKTALLIILNMFYCFVQTSIFTIMSYIQGFLVLFPSAKIPALLSYATTSIHNSCLEQFVDL